MKMKISHPRFLNIGSQKVMNMEFPACLEKKENSAQSDMRPTNKASDSVFLFPEVSVGWLHWSIKNDNLYNFIFFFALVHH